MNEFSLICYHVLCECVEKHQLNMSLEQRCPTDDRNVEMCVSRSQETGFLIAANLSLNGHVWLVATASVATLLKDRDNIGELNDPADLHMQAEGCLSSPL